MSSCLMGYYRLIFSIRKILKLFLVKSCSEGALKPDFKSANRFSESLGILEFSSILLLGLVDFDRNYFALEIF